MFENPALKGGQTSRKQKSRPPREEDRKLIRNIKPARNRCKPTRPRSFVHEVERNRQSYREKPQGRREWKIGGGGNRTRVPRHLEHRLLRA
jgi:hypothetical protein